MTSPRHVEVELQVPSFTVPRPFFQGLWGSAAGLPEQVWEHILPQAVMTVKPLYGR